VPERLDIFPDGIIPGEDMGIDFINFTVEGNIIHRKRENVEDKKATEKTKTYFS